MWASAAMDVIVTEQAYPITHMDFFLSSPLPWCSQEPRPGPQAGFNSLIYFLHDLCSPGSGTRWHSDPQFRF